MGGSGGVRVRVGDWLVRCIAIQFAQQEFSSVSQPPYRGKTSKPLKDKRA